MSQTIYHHLEPRDEIAATMQTLPTSGAQTMSLFLGPEQIVLFGSVEQLLDFARSVEQAARSWQMERDGVGEEDRAAVLAATP